MHVPLNMSCFQLSFISVCRWPFAWFWKYYIKHVFAQKIICIWNTLDAIYVHVLSSSLMSKSLLFHHRFHSFLIVIVWWIFHYVVDVDILNIWFFLKNLKFAFLLKMKNTFSLHSLFQPNFLIWFNSTYLETFFQKG